MSETEREQQGSRVRAFPRTGRRRLGLGLVVLGVALVASYYLRKPLFQGNFGEVEPGRVFRSAQPYEPGLGGLLRSRGIASVLNLRGGSADHDPWYADEVRTTRANGVVFYDFPMSATRRPTRTELTKLLDLFGRCRYPLLIHCKSGADRTGLATALYVLAVKGKSPDRALEAFTTAHAHVALLGPERLHEPFDEYRAWLAAVGLEHDPGRFRHWVEEVYASPEPRGPVRPIEAGPRARLARRPGDARD